MSYHINGYRHAFICQMETAYGLQLILSRRTLPISIRHHSPLPLPVAHTDLPVLPRRGNGTLYPSIDVIQSLDNSDDARISIVYHALLVLKRNISRRYLRDPAQLQDGTQGRSALLKAFEKAVRHVEAQVAITHFYDPRPVVLIAAVGPFWSYAVAEPHAPTEDVESSRDGVSSTSKPLDSATTAALALAAELQNEAVEEDWAPPDAIIEGPRRRERVDLAAFADAFQLKGCDVATAGRSSLKWSDVAVLGEDASNRAFQVVTDIFKQLAQAAAPEDGPQ
ncbi:hypothetical protein K488DRAFT_87317 [Vararia minispora EC-137]|uniref:Uncharacterized protein n=1 Tax=Vararia minispora EC-137 TaxID=1314806 RepID=A0ACB8QGV8_9AGAM|nr:hypothetical protein K488DRAFT_87317 [Vararia minispora EC-137]